MTLLLASWSGAASKATGCGSFFRSSLASAIRQIFGSPDDLKFHSSMTRFRKTADDPEPFRKAIDRHYAGNVDARTLQLLLKFKVAH